MNNCLVINQSLCATKRIQVIRITMLNPANLVRVFPIEFFKKFAIIKTTPEEISETATKLATNGDNP